MLKKYTIIALFLIQLIYGRTYADNFTEPKISIKGPNLVYEGILSADGFDQIKIKTKNNKQKIKWLYIDSPGGEINVSMDIGLWVFNNHMNVKVHNVCLSSCANYIFPAGEKKIIERNSIVAWHGSATQDSLNDLPLDQVEELLDSIEDPNEKELQRKKIVEDHANYIARMKQKQAIFFKTIGVDQSITIIGQSEKYNVKNFWAISVKDMAKFGITNVTAPHNYPENEVLKSDQIVLLKIAEP